MSNSGPLSVPNGQGDPAVAAALQRGHTATRAFAPADRAPAVDLGTPPEPDDPGTDSTSPTSDRGDRG